MNIYYYIISEHNKKGREGIFITREKEILHNKTETFHLYMPRVLVAPTPFWTDNIKKQIILWNFNEFVYKVIYKQ